MSVCSDQPRVTVPAEELLSKAESLRAETDGFRLMDWFAWRGPDSRSEVILQLRSAGGRRLQVMVTDVDDIPSLASIWPAVLWPQREAVERLGLRVTTGLPTAQLPTPLWTAAVRAVHDEEEGADDGEEADEFLTLGDPGIVTHCRLDLQVQLRRRIIAVARAIPGKTHSGFETLATRQGFAQLAPLAEGLNEQAPYAVGLAAILATEELLEVTPPPQITRLRMLLAEISRIGAHCAWLSVQSAEDEGLAGEALAARESVARLLAEMTGSRWATGVHRVGAIAAALTGHSHAMVAELTGAVDALCRSARNSMIDNPGWRRRYAGIAAVDPKTAVDWGLSGPVLRAAGVAHDVRRDAAYLDYAGVDFDVATGHDGDVADRVSVRLQEMDSSLSICRQCLDGLAVGEPRQEKEQADPALPGTAELIRHFKTWMDGHGHRAPRTSVYCPTESADGELAFWLAGDGTGKPAAVHLRSPSLFNFQLLEHLLPGIDFSQARGVVASMNIVAVEMDR